jgi:hypothetical protein
MCGHLQARPTACRGSEGAASRDRLHRPLERGMADHGPRPLKIEGDHDASVRRDLDPTLHAARGPSSTNTRTPSAYACSMTLRKSSGRSAWPRSRPRTLRCSVCRRERARPSRC